MLIYAFQSPKICSYRYAALFGVGCATVHVVPILVDDPPDFHPVLTDFNLNAWINVQKPIEAWVEGIDYHLYAYRPVADNIIPSSRYIIIHEPQDVATSPWNDFFCNVTQADSIHNKPLWRGNIVVFKTNWGMEIHNVNEEDLPFIKSLVTTYVLISCMSYNLIMVTKPHS